MEAIGLQVKPTAAFDPMGAARQGIELGILGMRPQQIQQELANMRAQEQGALIANQEAQRALDVRRMEDAARRQWADAQRKHTKVDEYGRAKVDRRAALEELRASGADPVSIEKWETDVLANEAGALKTGTEKFDFLRKTVDDFAPKLQFMEDENKAREWVFGKVAPIAKAAGMAPEEVGSFLDNHYGISRGGRVIDHAKTFVASSIDPAVERELQSRGLGFKQTQPDSVVTQQMRTFLQMNGIVPPAGANFTDLKNDPRAGPLIEAFQKGTLANVMSEEQKAKFLQQAEEAKIIRQKLAPGLKAIETLRQQLATRPGAIGEQFFQRWISQDPNRAVAEDALNKLNQLEGTNYTFADLNKPAVRALLFNLDNVLKTRQEVGSSMLGKKTYTQAGETVVPPEVQRERDNDSVRIIRGEYDGLVEKFKAAKTAEERQRAGANVDAAARELKKLKVDVPGATDILRGKSAPAAPRQVTFVSKRTGAVIGTAEEGSEKHKRMLADARLEVKR